EYSGTGNWMPLTRACSTLTMPAFHAKCAIHAAYTDPVSTTIEPSHTPASTTIANERASAPGLNKCSAPNTRLEIASAHAGPIASRTAAKAYPRLMSSSDSDCGRNITAVANPNESEEPFAFTGGATVSQCAAKSAPDGMRMPSAPTTMP